MKARCAVLCALGVLSVWGTDPGLTQFRNVYILPMAGALDQYLANRLAASGRYQVVTDPLQAHAILTDQIGEVFEDRMSELYPPPPPPPEKQPAAQKKEPKDDRIGMAMSEADAAPRRASSFGRGRGNVFLIERASRRVLWSTYYRPRNTQPDELDHVAGEVVDRLSDAVKKEAKRSKTQAEFDVKAAPAPAAPPAKPLATPPPAAAPVK